MTTFTSMRRRPPDGRTATQARPRASRCSASRSASHADSGVALILVLVFMTLFLAVAAALVSMTTMEARMAGAERARHAVRGAAEVALERALQELALAADWNAILAGSSRSRFVDTGAPPTLGEWGALDLAALTARLQRDTDAANQWGPNGQRWRLFASAALDTLLGADTGTGTGTGTGSAAGPPAPLYTVAWVADDPAEADANPSADTNGCVTVRAEAFGPFRSRQVLVATVRRHGASLEILSWQAPDSA